MVVLPTVVVDRLFRRLAGVYGAAWDRAMGVTPVDDLKRVWAEELGGFAGRLQDIAWALDNLPEAPPNVIQFRNLCRQAPAPAAPRLPAPVVSPERVAEVSARLGDLSRSLSQPAADPRGWARRILARCERGERVSPTVRRFAMEALAGAGGQQHAH